MINENFQLIKKAIRTSLRPNGLFNIDLAGRTYKVCYEASHYKEERDYRIIKSLARDKRCIFDVGANVGTSTLLLSEGNQAKVHAFEASEFASKIILQNIVANGIEERVNVINTLVGDKTGLVIPFYWAHSSGGASIFKGRLGHDFSINKVSLALDDYVIARNLRPDLLKVDVEGAEYIVLKGSLSTLRSSKPLVFLELHSVGEMPLWQNAEQIIELLRLCNYRMIYLRTKQEINNGRALEDRGRCHVLLMPAEFTGQDLIDQLDTRGL